MQVAAPVSHLRPVARRTPAEDVTVFARSTAQVQPPPPPRHVAERYLRALAKRDEATMRTLYKKDARFDDNVFHHTSSGRILDMWRKVPADANLTHTIVDVEGAHVQARLEWDYTFLGQKVHNTVQSSLTIVDGKIAQQAESFDFGAWAHQVLPRVPAGLLRFAQPLLARLIRMIA